MRKVNLPLMVGAATVLFGLLYLAPLVPAIASPIVERVVVQFDQPVRVYDAILAGTYVIEHDDARMARGEACTYIYRGRVAQPGNLVVTFHCTHLDRPLAASTKLVVYKSPELSSLRELKEFQFAGSTAAHGVPR